MAATKFTICSLALTEIGEAPISSFTDGTEKSEICGLLWDDYSRYLLSIFPWSFTKAKIQLGQLTTAPVNEYTYAYQLPGDMLRLWAVYNSGSSGAIAYLDYEVFDRRILTNASKIWVDYQKYVNPVDWPFWFVEFAVMALAAKLAPFITEQSDIKQRTEIKAFGTPQDNGQGGLFGQAKRIDSSQYPAEPIRHFELLSARFS